jgi:hypothetical protein
MARVVLTHAERSDLADRVDFNVWPAYNTHGDVLNRYWRRLYDDFPDFQFVLYDEDEDVVLGEGQSRTRSRRWRSRSDRRRRAAASAELLAPVRPSWKERYPLTPIERYARWTREDGLPFDPWIRTHVRLGRVILRPEPRSMRISGTVAEWEDWTEMAFPESGEYVFPHGLAPLAVDREQDLGLLLRAQPRDGALGSVALGRWPVKPARSSLWRTAARSTTTTCSTGTRRGSCSRGRR